MIPTITMAISISTSVKPRLSIAIVLESSGL